MAKKKNRYFEEVSFPEVEALQESIAPPAPVSKPTDLSTDILPQIEAIRTEISRMETGSSTLRSQALQSNTANPAMQALKRLEEDPTNRRLLITFIKMAHQDFGYRAAMHFCKLFEEADPNLEVYVR